MRFKARGCQSGSCGLFLFKLFKFSFRKVQSCISTSWDRSRGINPHRQNRRFKTQGGNANVSSNSQLRRRFRLCGRRYFDGEKTHKEPLDMACSCGINRFRRRFLYPRLDDVADNRLSASSKPRRAIPASMKSVRKSTVLILFRTA